MIVGLCGLGFVGLVFVCYCFIEDGGWDIEVGFMLFGVLDGVFGCVELIIFFVGEVVCIVYVGDYGGLGVVYEVVGVWFVEYGLVVVGDLWECYFDGLEVEYLCIEVYFFCCVV